MQKRKNFKSLVKHISLLFPNNYYFQTKAILFLIKPIFILLLTCYKYSFLLVILIKMEKVVIPDSYYMNQALDEAEKAFSKGEVPVGAIVICKERIIARAHNLTETLNDPTAHAEMQAITSAATWLGGKYLKECTIYITLEPCIMCAGALFWSQVPNIVYGASDPKRGYTLSGYPILNSSTSIRSGILENESSLLLKRFFLSRRKN